MLKSKKLQASILLLLGVAFKEIFNLELTTENLHRVLAIGVALVASYGFEDVLAIWRHAGKGKAKALYQSKRFWVALAGVVAVVARPEDRELWIFVIALLSGVSLPDLANAGKTDLYSPRWLANDGSITVGGELPMLKPDSKIEAAG